MYVYSDLPHHLPNYLFIKDYADRKQVAPGNVYRAINAKKITAINVGLSKVLMIDWEANKDFVFEMSLKLRKFKERKQQEGWDSID